MQKKMEKPLLVTQPFLPPLEEFEEYLKNIWDSKWLTNDGRYHQELENELCKYLGVNYISLFANGTLALVTALQALRITGEVITTPFSFVATTHALWWNNIKPVFVDIEGGSFNLDPDKIEAAITPKTTAILPVHVYGNPWNVGRIKQIADTYGLKVIYDACHTFDVRLNEIPILNYGDLSVMSFHATKVYNTFEGGAIICHDASTKKRIDNLKNFGFADGLVVAPGINAKMNEVQAAMGLLQLKYVRGAIESRRLIAMQYRHNFEDNVNIKYLTDFPMVKHCYPYFPILINKEKFGISRDDLFEELKKYNIYSRKYFYPLISQFPTYRGLESSQPGKMPVAEKIAEEVLCLPIHTDMGIELVDEICCIINLIHREQ